MSLPLPTSLTPSKVSSFRDCALAFRFSAIDRLPEPASVATARGTLVHKALERLFWEEDAGWRTEERALEKLHESAPGVLADREYAELALAGEELATFLGECETLVRNYFQLEDPNRVRVIGTEIRLEVTLGTLTLRGIIDRLELDDDGELVVTDYKTGKAPSVNWEQGKLGGVHFYAFLCEQVLGRRPSRIQLLHLKEPMAISSVPSEQSIRGLQQRTSAIWRAVETACEREDFRPKPSRLCDWCSFQAWCPSFGGDPAQAPSRAELQPA